MPRNAFCECPLKVLSEEAEERIHRAALALLDGVGVRIDCAEALRALRACGVRCELGRAYPDEMAVGKALASVQKGYTLHARGRQPARLEVNTSTTHTISGGAALRLCDGGRYRDATRDDLVSMIALHDALENIHIQINVVEPPEMSGPDLYPEMAALLFAHTGKPLLLQANGRRDLQKIIRMASLVAGGRKRLRERPIFMTGTNEEPPLHITREGAEVLMLAARERIPCSLGSYLMAGATGPLDVAAALAQRTASVLCGLVLTQAVRPGSPYDFSAQSAACDLATASVITMSPLAMQLIAGSIQMGRRYGMVTNALAATDSMAPDAQAAGERFFSMAVCVAAGASLIQGATAEMSGMALADFAQCALDNEIAGYALDFACGVGMERMDEAAASVEQVVCDPQYEGFRFLGHPLTARLCRRARYRHDLFTAGALAGAAPEKNLYDRAARRAALLMAERRDYVPPDLARELLKIARGGRR